MQLAEYAKYDGIGLAHLVKKKELTPDELMNTALEAISRVNPKINAIVQTLPNEIKKGLSSVHSGAFEGVPFLLKEYPAHASKIKVSLGSRLTKEGIAASQDSSLVKRFRQAGLITIGTTTTPEFAVDGTVESLLYGSTRNPWDLDRTPGGSSGGAAAAVASGIVPLAHGNDSGGSIRLPAAYCGLVGLKPTRGRVPSGPNAGEPLFGLGTEFALTKTIRDAAALLDAVSGPDAGCYAWAERPHTPYIEDFSRVQKPLRIAVMSEPENGVPVDPEILDCLHQTVKLCEELGHNVVEASPEVDEERHFQMRIRFWTTAMHREINELARSFNRIPSEENLEPVVYSAYQYGKSVTVDELLEAIEIQNTISRRVGQFFTEYDVLLSPTAAQLPVKLGEVNTNNPEWDVMEWLKRSDAITAFEGLANTTGLPALSLPLGWSKKGLPIGMQFIGRFADESALLRLASQIEQACPWKGNIPPVHVSMT